MAEVMRPGRVALDPLLISERRKELSTSLWELSCCVAVLARAAGNDVEAADVLERTRTAGRGRRRLVVSEARADLFATALGCEVADLEYESPLVSPFEAEARA